MSIKDNNVNLSITQVITSVVIALVIGGIMGGFAVVRTSDATALVVSGQEIRLEKLENNYMPRAELEREFAHINTSLLRLEESLNEVSKELKEHSNN